MTVVGAIQIAHVPVLPAVVGFQRGDPEAMKLAGALEGLSKVMTADGPLMDEMRGHWEALNPDVGVFFDCDHLNTFFLDAIPSIAVGVDDHTSGPSDHPLGHPRYDRIPLDRHLGDALHRGLISHGFDPVRAQRFTVDHSITVPLHFINQGLRRPIVPIWINGLGGVPITATRARDLGSAVAEILETVYADKRVVLISSGALSLDIGTPRVFPGAVFGIPAPEWVSRASELISQGDLDTLVHEATPDQFHAAGNASAELLLVITMMAALGAHRVPVSSTPVPPIGHMYATWTT